MTIKRAAPGENPFTLILNDVINDERLGADGLGILVYLISKPATWEVKIGDLRRQFGIGRDKAYKVLSHLVELGYAERYQGRDNSGGFSDNNYLIFDRIKPLPENTEAVRLPEMPYTANPTLQKKERKQTKDSPYSDEFEALWLLYPRTRNTSKKKAWDYFRMLDSDKQEKVRVAVPIFAAAMRAESRPEDKIMHFERFLNQRVYETVAAPASAISAPAGEWFKTATREQWQKCLKVWRGDMNWRLAWGPAPGRPGCCVPADLLTADEISLGATNRVNSQLTPESSRALTGSLEPLGLAENRRAS